MNWISVKDKLPSPYDDVLVYPRPTDYCCEAHYCHVAQDWYYNEYESYQGNVQYKCTVTHWMYLPEDPKE